MTKREPVRREERVEPKRECVGYETWDVWRTECCRLNTLLGVPPCANDCHYREV